MIYVDHDALVMNRRQTRAKEAGAMRQTADDRYHPETHAEGVTPASERAGGLGLVWLLPLLFCLPCLLAAIGGTAFAVAASGLVGALTQNIALTLSVGVLGLALAVGLVVLVRRRAAAACPPDAVCNRPGGDVAAPHPRR
jgi:hypothetical protein